MDILGINKIIIIILIIIIIIIIIISNLEGKEGDNESSSFSQACSCENLGKTKDLGGKVWNFTRINTQLLEIRNI